MQPNPESRSWACPAPSLTACWSAALLAVLLQPTLVLSQTEPADAVYLGGTVITMKNEGDTAQAVAVRAGKVTAVGTVADVRQQIGEKTKVHDLNGQTLLPGFYAAHDHLPGSGRVALFDVDLNSPPIGPIETMDQLIAALQQRASQTPKGKWVTGRGYDDTLLKEKRHPTRTDLDRASPDHPIWIVHTSGHLGVANSLALKIAKITKDTPSPAGGVIRKDPATGEPNGVFEERLTLISQHTPFLTEEQRLEAIRYCSHEYLSKGVTTTIIAGGAGNVVPELIEAHNRGWFKLRARAMVSGAASRPRPLGELEKLSPVPDFARYHGVKLSQDGSLQGLTGFLTRPYFQQPPGKDDFAGYPSRSRQQLVTLVRQYHQAGYQIAIHANGDAAIDDVLVAFRTVQSEMPRPDARHRIEHCQTPREDQLDAMRELGVTPSFFVGHVYYWGDRHRDLFLGSERAARISPLASAAQRGIRFTIHNDTPVTPVDPLLLVWCAVNRRMKNGTALGADQAISPFAALRSVTSDAAWQNFEEQTKGTIEAGKAADFVLLAENPLTIDPLRIKDIEILRTIVNGESVFAR